MFEVLAVGIFVAVKILNTFSHLLLLQHDELLDVLVPLAPCFLEFGHLALLVLLESLAKRSPAVFLLGLQLGFSAALEFRLVAGFALLVVNGVLILSLVRLKLLFRPAPFAKQVPRVRKFGLKVVFIDGADVLVDLLVSVEEHDTHNFREHLH